ncbi:uncharacterized protein LAESUDRAFT_516523 [Laetiporus sulphureus 93-53]|uniref:Uncharacterized protein n=1 Tax=Laetiporus sulphureus 93-53 TaxID=1314785 RepID=A0A165G100_9APHY|nr:uncharacterized protein LAESUDRAFT_516523 [Laetiporus sulphureus 93-53]KZT09685.1 hypothetical protein LAESUDRAFT_516523 [Laetiporus sulphureus 93-53]
MAGISLTYDFGTFLLPSPRSSSSSSHQPSSPQPSSLVYKSSSPKKPNKWLARVVASTVVDSVTRRQIAPGQEHLLVITAEWRATSRRTAPPKRRRRLATSAARRVTCRESALRMQTRRAAAMAAAARALSVIDAERSDTLRVRVPRQLRAAATRVDTLLSAGVTSERASPAEASVTYRVTACKAQSATIARDSDIFPKIAPSRNARRATPVAPKDTSRATALEPRKPLLRVLLEHMFMSDIVSCSFYLLL